MTVNHTIARLKKAASSPRNLIAPSSYTEEGRHVAASSAPAHETVVAFLRSLGVPERVAEMDAEGIEHHVSPETLTAFKSALRQKFLSFKS